MTVARRLVKRILSLGLLITLSAPTAVQAQPTTGTIAGQVRDSAGRPVGMVIHIVGSAQQATTDDSGRYAIEHAATGLLLLRAVNPLMNPIMREIRVAAGETTRVDFTAVPRIAMPRAVWLGCRGVGATAGRCSEGRVVRGARALSLTLPVTGAGSSARFSNLGSSLEPIPRSCRFSRSAVRQLAPRDGRPRPLFRV